MVLPAEFIAHIIAIYVHPANHMVASHFFQDAPSLDSLRNMEGMETAALDRVPKEKLFAWTYTIYCAHTNSGERDAIRDQLHNACVAGFEKRQKSVGE